MQKLLLFITLILLISLSAHADDAEFEVNVSIEAPRYTRSVAEDLARKAKIEALKKYMIRLDSTVGQDYIRKASAEIDQFVEDVTEKNSKWTDITNEVGQLSASYIVELKLEDINQWLKVNGFKTQGKYELVILEERPTIGSMKFSAEAGTASGAPKDFLQNYTSIQRRVRDSLIKKVDEFGFDVNLLSDNDMYAEYKDKDNELVGVFFDPEINNFSYNDKLLNAVKANNPDTIVLFYRLETLEFTHATKQIRITVALSLKNLDSNITKSFGTTTFALSSNASSIALLVDDIGLTAEKAILKLMNAEGAGARLNQLAQEFKNADKVPANSVRVTINAEGIDAKIRKRILYNVKKQIISTNITIADKVKSNNTSLIFETNPNFKDPEELYYERLAPIFEALGVEIDDDKIFYGKGSVTIKP